MSYSSRYTSSYSSRYGESSSRYGDTTSRYGSDILKEYTTTRDYSTRYSKKDLSGEYSRIRGSLYSTRSTRTLGDYDDQETKMKNVDIESIENAKYFGEIEKGENMTNVEEEKDVQNPTEIEEENVNNSYTEDVEITSTTLEIQDNDECFLEREESEEVIEDEVVEADAAEREETTNQTYAMSVSSSSPTQTIHEPVETITPVYQQSMAKETFIPAAVDNSGVPSNRITDEPISKSKVSDLIARYNAKCKEENNPSATNEWKHKYEFGNRTVGKIQSTIFH